MIHLLGAINRNWKSIVAKKFGYDVSVHHPPDARTDSESRGIFQSFLFVCSGDFSFSNHHT